MTVTELMKEYTPSSGYQGLVACDDWVLAVDISGGNGAVGDFAVAQAGITSLQSRMENKTTEKYYLRAGQATQKTSFSRVFRVAGDRIAGDAFQDYVLADAMRFATGEAAQVRYVYFCLLTGQGERGEASVLVERDGGGEAGGESGMELELRQAGGAPQAFTWSGVA